MYQLITRVSCRSTLSETGSFIEQAIGQHIYVFILHHASSTNTCYYADLTMVLVIVAHVAVSTQT